MRIARARLADLGIKFYMRPQQQHKIPIRTTTIDGEGMNNLFSINGAADLLEKDRATLVRALRHVPADGYTKHGQPRWRMPTIIDALAMKPQARRETGKYWDRYSIGRSKALDGLRVMFEKQIALISAEPSPVKRREMAVALAPLLAEYQSIYLNIGRSLRIADDDVLGARADLIWGEMMDEVSVAAEWPRSEGFFVKMFEVMWPHADDEEVG